MLSIAKLEDLMMDAGFIPKTYFTVHGLCVFVESVSLTTAETILLYIPSKYKFEVHGGYKLKYITMKDDDANIDQGDLLNTSTGENYPSIEIGSPDLSGQNVAEQLEENYKHFIGIDSISVRDRETLKDVYRQLKRFKSCVFSLKYKLAIAFSNYICDINRDDEISCFMVKNYSSDQRRILVRIELEHLYDRIATINGDVSLVKQNIFQIMLKNQSTHMRNLHKMITDLSKINLTTINAQIEAIDLNISRFEELLQRIGVADKKKEAEMDMIEKTYSLKQGFQHDVEKVHFKGKIEEDMRTISMVEKETLNALLALKGEKSHLLLLIDKTLFDSSVMSNLISKSLTELTKS